MFTFSSLFDLVTALQQAGLSADTEAAKLQLPGVWVQPQTVGRDTFGSSAVVGRLVLVVPDTDPTRALESLADLLGQVAGVYPVISAGLRTVLMPDGANLPGLEVPFSVTTPDTPAPAPED